MSLRRILMVVVAILIVLIVAPILILSALWFSAGEPDNNVQDGEIGMGVIDT